MQTDDTRFMGTAIALAERGRARSAPNPNVGCVIVKQGRILGRGWTQPRGRPHAEALALAQAGEEAAGATAYVTLEPCAHESERGPSCASALVLAGIARCVVAACDPDPRTDGKGIARMKSVGMRVDCGLLEAEARRSMAGWLSVIQRKRAFVTLKLATSLDGCIALASGESRWITGEIARAHGHLERARSNAVLVGRGTFDADAPQLDVRLAGLEDRSPARLVLGSRVVGGMRPVASPEEAVALPSVLNLLVEGGAQTAASFIEAGLVDRLLLYRAPIMIGRGKPCLGDIGLTSLASAHGCWVRSDTLALGNDVLEVYDRI